MKRDINLYGQIEEKLIEIDITNKVKDYSKNKLELDTYYEIGKKITEQNNKEEIIITKYNKIQRFYNLVEQGMELLYKLKWEHYEILIDIKNIEKINFYSRLAIENEFNTKELNKAITQKIYERYPEDLKKKLLSKGKEHYNLEIKLNRNYDNNDSK